MNALMDLNVNLRMALMNSNATRVKQCHIKHDHAMDLQKKGIAVLGVDAISCIRKKKGRVVPLI